MYEGAWLSLLATEGNDAYWNDELAAGLLSTRCSEDDLKGEMARMSLVKV